MLSVYEGIRNLDLKTRNRIVTLGTVFGFVLFFLVLQYFLFRTYML